MTQETNPQNIEQCRAKAAHALVTNNLNSDRLRAYSNSLPAMILTNGFGQTMAFIKMKGVAKDRELTPEQHAYNSLYTSIQDWLSKKELITINADTDLIKAITQISQQEYQIATVETLAYCKWIKQLATALIPSKDNSNVT
jgi:CRISPR-associated protein Cmr5